MLKAPRFGGAVAAAWVVGQVCFFSLFHHFHLHLHLQFYIKYLWMELIIVWQALWLQQGYNLEFLGLSSFMPGLFLASLGFFAVNVWILGVIVQDVGASSSSS